MWDVLSAKKESKIKINKMKRFWDALSCSNRCGVKEGLLCVFLFFFHHRYKRIKGKVGVVNKHIVNKKTGISCRAFFPAGISTHVCRWNCPLTQIIKLRHCTLNAMVSRICGGNCNFEEYNQKRLCKQANSTFEAWGGTYSFMTWITVELQVLKSFNRLFHYF